MKKIAFFMHNFNGGGAEKVTITIANNLSDKGYNVTMIVKDNIGELKNTIKESINVKNLDIQSKSNSKIIRNIVNLKLLKGLIENENYDAMISVTAPMNLVAAIANSISKNKVNLYATVHSMISHEKRKFKKIRYVLLRYFDKFIKKTIVVSNEAEEDYIKTIGISEYKTTTIYNPIISNKIFKMQNETIEHKWLKQNRKHKTIVAVGRLTEAKNYEMLLKSISYVKDKKDIRLIILGSGELEDKLKNLAKELNIVDIVDFKGYVENPYPYFKQCDLYTLSSSWEGLPSVLIEAMACGCKVISTQCPSGPKEILLNGKYGKLVPVNNYKLFAEGIIESLEQNIETNIQIKRAMEFSVESSIQKYLNLIEC